MSTKEYWVVSKEFDIENVYTCDFDFDSEKINTLLNSGFLTYVGTTNKWINDYFNIRFNVYRVKMEFSVENNNSIFCNDVVCAGSMIYLSVSPTVRYK